MSRQSQSHQSYSMDRPMLSLSTQSRSGVRWRFSKRTLIVATASEPGDGAHPQCTISVCRNSSGLSTGGDNMRSVPKVCSYHSADASHLRPVASLKYHRLHPEYLHKRIENLGHMFGLRILLVLCDVVGGLRVQSHSGYSRRPDRTPGSPSRIDKGIVVDAVLDAASNLHRYVSSIISPS